MGVRVYGTETHRLSPIMGPGSDSETYCEKIGVWGVEVSRSPKLDATDRPKYFCKNRISATCHF